MSRKNISQEKIITAFLFRASESGAGGTSLQDIAETLGIKKASLYNHFESREAMYEKSLLYCKRSLDSFTFLPEKFITQDLFQNESLSEVLNRLIKRFIQFYESEPFFQIYIFVHSERYFNQIAAKIADDGRFKIELGLSQLLLRYCMEKKLDFSPVEIDNFVKFYSNFLENQLDSYIANKKEIIRQNPECGVGTLFALPTDDEALQKMYDLSKNYLSFVGVK